MGRIQHSTHPTRSCMDSKTRTPALTERVAPLVLQSEQGGWESTTTRFSALTSMMDMVESDEDSGLPSAAEHEPGSTMLPPPTSCPHMTLCYSSFIIHVYYRHLLISIHVNDRFTTSLAFFFPLPSFGPPHRPRIVHPSVYTLTFWVSIHGQNDRLSLIVTFPPSCQISI